MPLSCVIGRRDVLDLYPPGSMSSTHSGNPVCCAAALANLEVIDEEHLVANARRLGDDILQPAMCHLADRFESIGMVHGRGLVGSLQMVKPGSDEPDPAMAKRVVWRAVEKGLMLFAPVGYGGASVKLCPPLCIPDDALREGLDTLTEAIVAAEAG